LGIGYWVLGFGYWVLDIGYWICANSQPPTTKVQQPTTNNQQPTSNNQQPTTNNQQPTTNHQQPTTNNQPPMTKIAMLASGSGTNVENFINYFRDHPVIEIALVVCDRDGAYVRARARKYGIPEVLVSGPGWKDPDALRALFTNHRIDFLVLAGFLRLVPHGLIADFPDRILNIHPALLPDFGGKGMYGMHVHRAVIESGVRESGISIHLVNERYDEGRVLFQARIRLAAGESPESLAARIHALEYAHYPAVVEGYVQEYNYGFS
jgi:phosphoribosylglycinamide formyltransferase 1